jgi:phospholipase A1
MINRSIHYAVISINSPSLKQKESGMFRKKILVGVISILSIYATHTYAATDATVADTPATTPTAAPDAVVTTSPTVPPKAKVKKHHHHKIFAPVTVPVAIDATPLATPVDQRIKEEKKASNPFVIAFYKPTYVIPYYYTFSPDNAIYRGNTPNGESLKNDEIKYQLSFKVPVWKNIFGSVSSLYFAYTQMSYWQAYNRNAFFRSTDYEPEFFLQNEFNWRVSKDWQINSINIGLVHQSNGYGNSLERSWNRAYLNMIASTEHWAIAVKPWIIFHDSVYEEQNPNMANFLGYGTILVACKFSGNTISLETRNFIESGGRRSGNTLSWSFPMTKYLNGYVQVFSGYGQSLIEYDHRTNSVGLGFSLSNWI